MNGRLIGKALRECKEAAKLDWSVMYADTLGDCMSCCNWKLGELYPGDDKFGIFCKKWRYGMNAHSKSFKDDTSVAICHTLNAELYPVVCGVLSKYFCVEPKEYDECKCIILKEKSV